MRAMAGSRIHPALLFPRTIRVTGAKLGDEDRQGEASLKSTSVNGDQVMRSAGQAMANHHRGDRHGNQSPEPGDAITDPLMASGACQPAASSAPPLKGRHPPTKLIQQRRPSPPQPPDVLGEEGRPY